MESSDDQTAWFLKSSRPVIFPAHDGLTKPQAEFDAFIAAELGRRHDDVAGDTTAQADPEKAVTDTESETFTLVSESTSAEIRQGLAAMDVDTPDMPRTSQAHPFIKGLAAYQEKTPASVENKMLTENGDVAHRSSTSAVVDLFAELEDVVSGPLLASLLESAWREDALVTLKIIFNARSIHLGKSSRSTFYRAAGWLATTHPLTLIANLRWLSRPVIEKKVKKDDEEDIVLVEPEHDEEDFRRFDVKYGVAHGYWKDLLNILALAVNNKLSCNSNPRDILNSENPGIIRGKSVDKNPALKSKGTFARHRDVGGRGRGRGRGRGGTSRYEERPVEVKIKRALDPKKERHDTRDRRHAAAVKAFNTNPTYRALHLTVARLFAEQLQADLAVLRGSDAKAKKSISLCGKWAPSQDCFHDKHTFIVSSIAEIMHPRESLDTVLLPTDDRETYLRYAREEYRKGMSALRKHLEIVERDLTTNTFANIKYDRIPSIAMKNYAKLFIEKDLDRFENYLDRVAEGKAKISGATLLPSTLVHAIMPRDSAPSTVSADSKSWMSPAQLIEAKVKKLEERVVDGQWNALVQRIKDSGTLSSSIAVCDVSGSMCGPRFHDQTCPMDSAIGLSLLVAEVTQPPFGGAFITFSAKPTVERVDLSKPLAAKIVDLNNANWGMNTNFVAVFEDLILPMAIENKLAQEDMVKRVFVFSDMQFDVAERTSQTWENSRVSGANDKGKWSTSFERVQKKYKDAGYEMPELIFWNLAGGRAGYGQGSAGDPIAPKPVTTTDVGTSLVSGYSQGMLKLFLDNGSFEDEEESEDEVVVTKGEDGETVTAESPRKKVKMDPLKTVKKAIGHKAYDMLKVLD